MFFRVRTGDLLAPFGFDEAIRSAKEFFTHTMSGLWRPKVLRLSSLKKNSGKGKIWFVNFSHQLKPAIGSCEIV